MSGNNIGYRAKILKSHDDRMNMGQFNFSPKVGQWFGTYRSYLGEQGVAKDPDSLKNSIRTYGYRKGEYEIWKIYIGIEMPGHPDWFPPEKVEL